MNGDETWVFRLDTETRRPSAVSEIGERKNIKVKGKTTWVYFAISIINLSLQNRQSTKHSSFKFWKVNASALMQ
jgi:hypothetical protein